MRPFSSRQIGFAVLLSLTTLLLTSSAFGQSQSLGDIARENREKKEESSATPPKVITNKTLPTDPDAITTATDEANHNAPGAKQDRVREEQEASQGRAREQRAEARWHERIMQQARLVANLRMRVDRLKAAIRFTDPNYGNGSTGVTYNGALDRRLDRLAQLQQQFDREKYKLEQMQEAARHAGMHSRVYEP